MLYLIDEKKISRAYLNQAISALKFYFDRVLRKPKVVGELPRPRRESTLPIILSRAKGRKDRYVPLSSVALETLCQYWKAYQLEGWLFPGARKGKHLMAEAA